METIVGGGKSRYFIDGRLGRASKMSGIMTGRDETGQRVTVKRLERYGTGLSTRLSKFYGIESPELPTLRDVFVGADGCLYIVKDYIEGTDMKSLMTDKSIYGKVDEMQFVRMACGVLRALMVIHSRGVVHRNVKPSNIIFRHREGESPLESDFSDVVLIDFERASAWPADGEARSAFTLIYSSPEMILKRNEMVGPTADLYALGITLYHLVMGKSPFTDCNPEVLIGLQMTYPIKKPSRMTDELYSVIRKASWKEPFRLAPRKLPPEEIDDTLRKGIEGRYQKAEEMLDDLLKVTKALRPQTWIEKKMGI